MNRWRMGEDRGSKGKDQCPLTAIPTSSLVPWMVALCVAPGSVDGPAVVVTDLLGSAR
jgi:hypothetical protein